MTIPQGLAHFPGVLHVVEASITRTHGVSPSSATLTIAPQPGLPRDTGDLVFTFAGQTFVFRDCRIDKGAFQQTRGGQIWRLTLFDRRWKWRYGQISGTYNVFRDNGTLDNGEHGGINTERTPQELAELCLVAMGETDFDVSRLPNDPRPSVEWENVVPAQALASLCEKLACRVVLTLDDRVVIHRVNEGEQLPDLPALENATTVDSSEMPDAFAVVCGANRYQVDFHLEAVGLESDTPAESLVSIDELAYKPPGGWSAVDVPYFHQIDHAYRTLAQKSVFRYYRIRVPIDIPGYNGPNGTRVDRLEQILPIEAEQVATSIENGQESSRPAVVFGVWYPETGAVANSAPSLEPLPNQLSSPGGAGRQTIYQGGYTIDTARGLVIFDEPVYRNAHGSATGGAGFEVQIAPAQLVLRAAASVRDPLTQALTRYERSRSTGANRGTPPHCLPHDEIVLTHIPTYTAGYTVDRVDTNREQVDAQCDVYLDLAEQEFSVQVPQTVRYAGLWPVELDGAIHQVTLHVGPSGATTTVARHTELTHLAGSLAERRRIERGRQLEAAAERTSPRGLARTARTNRHARSRPRS